MDIWPKYKSPLGYLAGDSKIDTYGVDHSKFSLRDEIAYQMARADREEQLIKSFNSQGINKDYPQYGTNFWGGNADNNYGFGSSDISENIENVTNSLKNSTYAYDPNTGLIAPTPQQNQALGQQNNAAIGQNNNTTIGQQNTLNAVQNKHSQYIIQPDDKSLQVDIGLKPLDDTNSFTTDNSWNYPNSTSSPFYEKMGRPYSNTANTNQQVDYSLYGDGFSKEYIDLMLKDADYIKALEEYAIPNERGYVNNPLDPGGETNMGIAKRYHKNEDIKNLTRERANAILYKEYWNCNGINKLPREIRGFVFDHGIRTCPQNAIKTTHQALDIYPTGTIIGQTTLDKLKNLDYEEFLHRYQNIVREQDKNNSNYKYFGRGWDDRTNKYHVSY